MSYLFENRTLRHELQVGRKEAIIAVIGSTGSGKSSFINTASGTLAMAIGNERSACTRAVESAPPFEFEGRAVTLIDTPGIDDTTLCDVDVMRMLVTFLESNYTGKKVTGIIYMHRISDIGGGISLRCLRILRALLGDSEFTGVVILASRTEGLILDAEEVGKSRQHQLEPNSTPFERILDKGGQKAQHNGSMASAHRVLKYLIHKDPEMLQRSPNYIEAGAAKDKVTPVLEDQSKASLHKSLEMRPRKKNMIETASAADGGARGLAEPKKRRSVGMEAAVRQRLDINGPMATDFREAKRTRKPVSEMAPMDDEVAKALAEQTKRLLAEMEALRRQHNGEMIAKEQEAKQAIALEASKVSKLQEELSFIKSQSQKVVSQLQKDIEGLEERLKMAEAGSTQRGRQRNLDPYSKRIGELEVLIRTGTNLSKERQAAIGRQIAALKKESDAGGKVSPVSLSLAKFFGFS
ncbi:hypothetical protein DFP72DRAFT_1068465 [Ephemerocybe angulata]|uniref:G domain-containing protein n=1 Tax=Ephemerocybe angulata TaxID=980116 RepID=A0A8H6HY32_9AGAR|nr:hypothetical protein DFP72DRAFT_1068465 [Tulosesus angulatus]